MIWALAFSFLASVGLEVWALLVYGMESANEGSKVVAHIKRPWFGPWIQAVEDLWPLTKVPPAPARTAKLSMVPAAKGTSTQPGPEKEPLNVVSGHQATTWEASGL